MSRTLIVLLALGLLAPSALAQEEEDPFADANETGDEEDPFATYEQRRNETFQSKQNETNATAADEDGATTATPTASATPAATPTPSPTAEAAAETPGFGLAALAGALGVALIVLRRRS